MSRPQADPDRDRGTILTMVAVGALTIATAVIVAWILIANANA